MSHEIRRVLRAFSTRAWFIDPRKAEEIVALLEYRALHGPRPHGEKYRAAPAPRPAVSEPAGKIVVLRLYGSIVPRMEAVEDVSATAASMVDFQRAFSSAANDPSVKAIVIDVDSPGGTVDLVPETAAMIRAAHRAERPIVAVANTLAASAAYWIASAADELVVTPSGEVGSIGVYMMHQDVSAALEAEGVRITFISEGPRKVEGNPFEPLGAESRAALQANVRHYYDLFTRDVAKHRGVPVEVVRADPEKAEKHFGGGRTYPAYRAVALGMADRVDTLENTIRRLQLSQDSGGTGADARRKAADRRRRLAVL